jgi:3-phosphoshikimate 1-carboxyvinyltransferase
MTQPLEIVPVARPVCGVARPPGSKSLTNRALVVAALASGTSTLRGVLNSRDTEVMFAGLSQLGISIEHSPPEGVARVTGCAGRPPAAGARLWLENSGTSIRFLAAVCALARGRFLLDGNSRMRERPIGDLVAALRDLGADARCENSNNCPPVIIAATGLRGGLARVAGQTSSQFASALLMAAPAASAPVTVEIAGELVSQPYVEMTSRVMQAFGVAVDKSLPGRFRVEPALYQEREFEIEPDASAASYFFAAAAITGGEVTVEGLSRDSLQGDLAFVDVLAKMGCRVEYEDRRVTVRGAPLRGVDVDMNAISDTAQTLSAVAPFAAGSTRIRNIAHVRHKETDRIQALAAELTRIGQQVDVYPDGLEIHPRPVKSAVIETYDDHRMAMSLALVGLKVPGISIADPGCTAKTYPAYFDDLRRLCGTA